MTDLPSIALLGTGTMGAGMARSMLRARLPLTVWNRSVERAQPLAADGATVATTAVEAVRDADIVVTMLFDTAAVEQVMAPLMGDLKPGAVWVQSSTVGVAGIQHLHDLTAPHGTPFIDAPVVGTKQPAEQGTLTVLAAGHWGLREVVRPVFDAVGAKTVWVGEQAGGASALKLVANAWVATLTAATAQSIAMSRALGVDPERFLEAVAGGAADSPYLHAKGRSILDGTTDDAQFALDGLLKDVNLMRDAVAGTAVTPTLLDALVSLYGDASRAGRGSADIAAVITALEAARQD